MKKYMIDAAICNKIIKGIPTINFTRFVLWRISSIVIIIARDPPMTDSPIRVASGTLKERCFALILSATVTIIDIKEITAKYIYRYSIISSGSCL